MIQFVNHIIYFFEVVIRKRPEMEIFASKDVPKNNTFFLIPLFCTFGLVTDRVLPRNPGFGFWKCHEEMILKKVKRGFSSIFDNYFFGIFDDLTKFRSAFGSLHFVKSSKFCKLSTKVTLSDTGF